MNKSNAGTLNNMCKDWIKCHKNRVNWLKLYILIKVKYLDMDEEYW